MADSFRRQPQQSIQCFYLNRKCSSSAEVLQFTSTYVNGQGKLGLHTFGTRTLDAFLLEQS